MGVALEAIMGVLAVDYRLMTFLTIKLKNSSVI
jgi:hypothetical protein